MSLNHFTDLNEKKYLKIGAESIIVYGSTILNNSVQINPGGAPENIPLEVRLSAAQGQDVGNLIVSFDSSGDRFHFSDQNLSVIPVVPPKMEFLTGAGGLINVNGKNAIQLYDNDGGLFTSVIIGTQNVIPNASITGFVYVPAIIGTPTGVPSVFFGSVPMCIDSPGQKLWAYTNGAWHGVALT